MQVITLQGSDYSGLGFSFKPNLKKLKPSRKLIPSTKTLSAVTTAASFVPGLNVVAAPAALALKAKAAADAAQKIYSAAQSIKQMPTAANVAKNVISAAPAPGAAPLNNCSECDALRAEIRQKDQDIAAIMSMI